jgi:hypothetical protein
MAMSPQDAWVARRNAEALRRQLDDPRFADMRVELLRQLADQEFKLTRDGQPPQKPVRSTPPPG